MNPYKSPVLDPIVERRSRRFLWIVVVLGMLLAATLVATPLGNGIATLYLLAESCKYPWVAHQRSSLVHPPSHQDCSQERPYGRGVDN
jgi:hypothetical protein